MLEQAVGIPPEIVHTACLDWLQFFDHDALSTKRDVRWMVAVLTPNVWANRHIAMLRNLIQSEMAEKMAARRNVVC